MPEPLPHPSLATAWRAVRESPAVLHVASAAAGRTSRPVRERMATHLDTESVHGAYVAEAGIADELDLARSHLGALVGATTADVVFLESSSNALAAALASVLRPAAGGAIWTTPIEWGPNLAAFAGHGLVPDVLRTDATGAIDLEDVERRLRAGPPVAVNVVAMASHRAVRQPVGELAALCERAGVPLLVDAAQALAHVPIEPGAAIVYGTGRKWLCGPRGVGYLVVREPWRSRVVPVAPAVPHDAWPGDDRAFDRLDSREASVAGRAGFGVALQEHMDHGPERVHDRLAGIGRALRTAFTDDPSWALVDPVDAPGAIVSLRPRDPHVDVEAATRELGRRGVLATASGPFRAPDDPGAGWLLRLSPHVDVDEETIERLVTTVRAVAPAG